ncbi:MAG: hypothetical protein JW932_12815 [Deltaproteobacteria bacterium]|nr:hypothetical protein [Deltaproteobacteria bacterium]
MATENDNLKIQDLVEVPEIRTVIQLEDLKDPGLRGMIVETFVITSEVLSNLQAILASLTGPEGRGIFLKGHFGSGKSHFLSMLSVLLKAPQAWETVLSQSPSLKDYRQRLTDRRFLVVERSLVQHRGSEFLEDIILRAVWETLGEDTVEAWDDAETRHETFLKLKDFLKEKGFSGLVILVDELSEFLRSKTDARAYHEDIRFLQYLGEEAVSFPMWIVASLQEWIEETGEIHQDTFNKIKDRYRIRLNLGRAHIEELVSERLIRHKPGADSEIGRIFDKLKTFFPTFPVTRDRFIRLYPVHPATSSLLDRLKPLFSEHRGVVDFIHFRLKGDPERHIPSMMALTANHLLTPETIFDHFLDRIRERAETQVYVQRVFESSEQEIHRLFPDRDQKTVALAAVKLLILFAVSPVQYKFTVRHMAEMILFRITSLDSGINYEFLHDILLRLSKEGLYIRFENHDDPLDDHFYIDLKADMAGIVRRRIRHQASQLFPDDRRLFWKTAALSDSPYVPLKEWTEKGRQQVTTRWQQTPRTGILLLRQLDELTVDEIEGLAGQEARSEEDFFILAGTTYNREGQYRHVKDTLLPLIRDRHQGRFLFWVPAPVKGDVDWLKEILAAILMNDETHRGSDTGQQEEKEILEAFIDGERKRVTEHYTHYYYQGLLLWDENETDLSKIGVLSQEKFLAEFVPPLLERRFPRHSRVQPFMSAPTAGILRDMLWNFLLSGIMVVEQRQQFGLRDVLDNILKPMGLVRSKGNQYELHVNPKQNELARYFFTVMGERQSVPLDEMYWDLRKGEYGLLMPYFEILILSLLFSGHLVAYKMMNRKSPDELARTGLKGVTALGKGEIIAETFRQALPTHPLIPKPFRNIPMTLVSQEELWAQLKSQKSSAMEDLASLGSRIKWASHFDAFKNMPWERVLRDIEDLTAQWDEVKTSLSSKDGLERFIRAGQREPFLEEKHQSLQACHRFLDQVERGLFIYQYLTDQRLHIPEQNPYAWEQEDAAYGVREGNIVEGYDRLRSDQSGILAFFTEKQDALSSDMLDAVFDKFQDFQESYIRIYTQAHNQARGGARFEPYEKLAKSKPYDVLKRLDQLEMISVEHNYRSVNQALLSVTAEQCSLSPRDHLQRGPVCACGFRIGESKPFTPFKEIEAAIELGISETLASLHAPAIQEKILPYLESLDMVDRKPEADTVRQLLAVKQGGKDLLDQLDKALTPRVIRSINEAFRGKVVVVRRDLDQLYHSLVHRKYTLAQLRKILRDWLKEETIADDTFLHFVGRGEGPSGVSSQDDLSRFLEAEFRHLLPLYQEIGHQPFVRLMIAVLWAEEYNVSEQEITDAFALPERRSPKKTVKWMGYLRESARVLYKEKRSLFETCITEIEQDSAFIKTLWTLLADLSPISIFEKETLFPGILKEAFERLFIEKPKEDILETLPESFGTSDPGEGLRCLAHHREMMEVLKTYGRFRHGLSALNVPKREAPETFEKWETFYIQTLATLPYQKEALEAGFKRLGVNMPHYIKEEGQEAHTRVLEKVQAFSAFYESALREWEAGKTPRPVMIQDIPGILSRKRNVPDHQRVCFVLMDGMRWDLWECIKADFFEKNPNLFRFIREGALWANQPTSTAPQLVRFEEALKAVYPDTDEDLFWKIGMIDEKVHSEKGPLPHLFATVLRSLEMDLFFRFRDLPSRTLLLLFSDHGFMGNPAFRPDDKYDAPRYTHGKDSPFEVIVPWAWVIRI